MKDAKEILDAIRRIVRGLRLASRASERNVGLSAAQLFVLQKLGAARRLSLKELAEQTLTHQSSVSVVVSRLAALGMINRRVSAEDARRLDLSITPAGRLFLRKLPATIQERLISAIQEMPAAKRRQLSQGLSLLVDTAGLSGQKPSLFFEEEEEEEG